MDESAPVKRTITISHIRDLTITYGEGWAYPHVQRTLTLIEKIGTGLDYDQEVVLYAAFLHDWGAFPRYRRPGVDHAARSRQIAGREILPFTVLSEQAKAAVLDAIETHDYTCPRQPTALEGQLLREADMLDMLGVIGAAREFAGGGNNLKASVERLSARAAIFAAQFSLAAARQIAQTRILTLEQFLENLQAESFGYL